MCIILGAPFRLKTEMTFPLLCNMAQLVWSSTLFYQDFLLVKAIKLPYGNGMRWGESVPFVRYPEGSDRESDGIGNLTEAF